MILYRISGVDGSACGRMNGRINGAMRRQKMIYEQQNALISIDETRIDKAHRLDRHSLVGSAFSVAQTLDKWLKLWTIFGSLGRQKGGTLDIIQIQTQIQICSKVK